MGIILAVLVLIEIQQIHHNWHTYDERRDHYALCNPNVPPHCDPNARP